MRKIMITGSGSGLGKEIYRKMESLRGNLSHTDYPLQPIGVDIKEGQCVDLVCDITGDLRSITEAPGWYGVDDRLDGLINCAGINYIDWFEKIPDEMFRDVLELNVTSIFRVSKALLRQLTGGVILNVVSNACRIPMTHSAAYNASKGAAEILTKQMARELTKTHSITVFGINPNKLKGTGMSKAIEEAVCDIRDWTPEEAAKYQAAALPAGFETKPEWIAELVTWLLEKPHRYQYLTGCMLDLGA